MNQIDAISAKAQQLITASEQSRLNLNISVGEGV